MTAPEEWIDFDRLEEIMGPDYHLTEWQREFLTKWASSDEPVQVVGRRGGQPVFVKKAN